MQEVNVREARKHFSELLDRVSKGEEVIVLRRGEAVARLSQPIKPTKRLPCLSAFRSEMGLSNLSSTELLREERDER
jgi:prevent-host-death family protein